MTVTENVIVWIIVGAVLLLAGRSFYLMLTGRSGSCGCSGGGGCPPGPPCNRPDGANNSGLDHDKAALQQTARRTPPAE